MEWALAALTHLEDEVGIWPNATTPSKPTLVPQLETKGAA